MKHSYPRLAQFKHIAYELVRDAKEEIEGAKELFEQAEATEQVRYLNVALAGLKHCLDTKRRR